ncbi:S-adenosyl-L-methionine-dependent methyltransferases superfamily protein [Prunus dulcis]|uniref:S-adenosyl-L-methionine-dependent methyltransferases superfamily protein n=1 Tax=Prunus dulcis TaxID=3755 RepID=A0A4Y1QTB1_PRUDU|nr:S-adenosyl-L-methionine-dependent methyltransferases superfamily protein [Prunus dulcis]
MNRESKGSERVGGARRNEARMNRIMQLPYDATVRFALSSLERNLLPDAVVRRLTRLLLASRLRSALKEMPIAIKTDDPKAQHYEVPTSFFKIVLGKNLKYRNLQLQNVEIIVADVSTFAMEASYDRIFSIEMFEDKSEDDWITSNEEIQSSSKSLVNGFLDDVTIVNHWLVNGKHYTQTSEEWLKRMDQNVASITNYGVNLWKGFGCEVDRILENILHFRCRTLWV